MSKLRVQDNADFAYRFLDLCKVEIENTKAAIHRFEATIKQNPKLAESEEFRVNAFGTLFIRLAALKVALKQDIFLGYVLLRTGDVQMPVLFARNTIEFGREVYFSEISYLMTKLEIDLINEAQNIKYLNSVLEVKPEKISEIDIAVLAFASKKYQTKINDYSPRFSVLREKFDDYRAIENGGSAQLNNADQNQDSQLTQTSNKTLFKKLKEKLDEYRARRNSGSAQSNNSDQNTTNQFVQTTAFQSTNKAIGSIVTVDEFFRSNGSESFTYDQHLLDLATNGASEIPQKKSETEASCSSGQNSSIFNIENWWFVAVPASSGPKSIPLKKGAVRLFASTSQLFQSTLARFSIISASVGVICFVADQMLNMNDYRHSRDMNFASTNEIINQQILGYQINGQNFDANYDVLSPNSNQYDASTFRKMIFNDSQNTMIYAYPKSQYSFEDLKSIHIALGQG